MHFAQLSPVEQRVLGCLIEKRWTTPEQYPLSVNSLRLACNQSTNRDPVTEYSEPEVYEAAQRLTRYSLVRLASGHTARSIKFRHLAEEGLGLDRGQLAVLCVLLLRGPQTPGELKARSERMAHLESLTEVDRILDELGERGYAARQTRRPGQKEDRFAQLLGGDGIAPEEAPPGQDDPGVVDAVVEPGGPSGMHGPGGAGASGGSAAPPVASAPSAPPGLEARVAALEAEVAALRAQLAALSG